MDVRFGWASGFAFFPNGNLLISDYTGRRLVEVDPSGKVVNELRTGSRTVASVSGSSSAQGMVMYTLGSTRM